MGHKHKGICRVCGFYKELTYEHIPPKKAFNTEQVAFQTLQDIVQGHNHTKFRQGMGLYTLCEKCNNDTGGRYGEAFAEWTRQGFNYLDKLEGERTPIQLPFWIKPLNVIKQVTTMALATFGEEPALRHSELRQFVLNKERKYLPPNTKFYVYFNRTGKPRLASGAVVMNIKTNRGAVVQSEVTLPPFGYAVCGKMKNSLPMADYWAICDITWFSQFDYNIWTCVYLKIPHLETHYPFPMDYRTREEIESKS